MELSVYQNIVNNSGSMKIRGYIPRIQTVDKALLLQGFAIVGTAFLI